MSKILNFAISDFKLVFRDASLRLFLLMPILIFLGVGPFLNYLTDTFPVVADYTSYIIMAAVPQASIMFGFIYAMVFIDEKESEVNKVYAVVPESKSNIISSRLILPTLVSTLITFSILNFQKYTDFTIIEMIYCSIIGGLATPILALLVAGMSKNKMEGLTWFKIINSFLTIPILAFFAPKFKILFALFPTHWLYQGMNASMNESPKLFFFIVGIIYSLILSFFLIRFFLKRQFR